MTDKSHRFICMNGTQTPYNEATIHVASVAVKYAAQVFEGIRCYLVEGENRLNILALEQHVDRLFDSCHLMRMDMPYTREEVISQVLETVKANDLNQDSYIRLACSVNTDGPIFAKGPGLLTIAAFPQARKDFPKGQKVCINGWQRISDAQMPPRVKCVANYQNGRLALMQAKMDGYDNVLLTDSQGKACEAPTATFFMLRNGELVTPPVTSGILESITRDMVIKMAKRNNIPVVQRSIDRTELYIADSAFFCGTGAEILPIASVDQFDIDTINCEVFQSISKQYFNIARGLDSDFDAFNFSMEL
jgi:branched-chain amino acid aminotransferase